MGSSDAPETEAFACRCCVLELFRHALARFPN